MRKDGAGAVGASAARQAAARPKQRTQTGLQVWPTAHFQGRLVRVKPGVDLGEGGMNEDSGREAEERPVGFRAMRMATFCQCIGAGATGRGRPRATPGSGEKGECRNGSLCRRWFRATYRLRRCRHMGGIVFRTGASEWRQTNQGRGQDGLSLAGHSFAPLRLPSGGFRLLTPGCGGRPQPDLRKRSAGRTSESQPQFRGDPRRRLRRGHPAGPITARRTKPR